MYSIKISLGTVKLKVITALHYVIRFTILLPTGPSGPSFLQALHSFRPFIPSGPSFLQALHYRPA